MNGKSLFFGVLLFATGALTSVFALRPAQEKPVMSSTATEKLQALVDTDLAHY